MEGMKDPSDKRKRTLALHERAIRFRYQRERVLPAISRDLAKLPRLGSGGSGGR